MSDTVDRMLRPQGLFHPPPPAPAEWQAPPAPAPGYPANGESPTPPAPYPAGPQYQAGGFPEAGPPAWPGSAGLPTPSPGYPPGGYAAPDGTGQYTDPPYQGGQPGTGQYPGAPYPNGQYQTGQLAGGQDPTSQYPTSQYPGAYPQDPTAAGQYGLSGPYGPDGLTAPADASAGGGGLGRLRRKKGPLIAIAAAAVAVIAVAVALTLSSGGSSPGPSTSASSSAGASAPGAASGKAVSQRQAASALAGLLSQSGTDHADVNAAVTNVEACKNLTGDAKTFNRAARNRRTLLAKLAKLPGRSALSPAMLADLTGAWQASATVDSDLATWAADGVGGCKKNNLKDPSYAASVPFDSTATNDKTAFVKAWNSLARKYGYPSYTPAQL